MDEGLFEGASDREICGSSQTFSGGVIYVLVALKLKSGLLLFAFSFPCRGGTRDHKVVKGTGGWAFHSLGAECQS